MAATRKQDNRQTNKSSAYQLDAATATVHPYHTVANAIPPIEKLTQNGKL